MTLHVYEDLEQGTNEWLAARCGTVTASVIGQLITKGPPEALTVDCVKCGAEAGNPCLSTARKIPTPIKTIHDDRATVASLLPPIYRPAINDTSRALTATLVAQRITGHVEPVFPSRDMERGTLDEPYAREKYSKHHAPATEVGFMVRDDWGFRIGYSPDGVVGDDGLIEIKSRAQKKHLATILADEVPTENMAQLQCGLLVSGRQWIDYVSYCGGMPLWTKRVYTDTAWQDAIIAAVCVLEANAEDMISRYLTAAEGLPATERIDHFAELSIY